MSQKNDEVYCGGGLGREGHQGGGEGPGAHQVPGGRAQESKPGKDIKSVSHPVSHQVSQSSSQSVIQLVTHPVSQSVSQSEPKISKLLKKVSESNPGET